jgi:hypothetical protein
MAEENSTVGAIANFLSSLRSFPLWVLAGLSAAAWAVLYFIPLRNVGPPPLQGQLPSLVRIAALTFSGLTLAKLVNDVVSFAIVNWFKPKALRIVVRGHGRRWFVAKQPDGTFVSQIALDVEITNLTDQPVRIVSAQLIRPKPGKQLLNAVAHLYDRDQFNNEYDTIAPRSPATANLFYLIHRAIAPTGSTIRVTVGITDQFGHRYRARAVPVRSPQPPVPRPSLGSRFKDIASRRRAPTSNPPKPEAEPFTPPVEWSHDGRFNKVEAVLTEEGRHYAANGRQRGGLGSFDTTLQSEPNFGWTQLGQAPPLLWERGRAAPIRSDNAARLLRLRAQLDSDGQSELDDFLLSHLDKHSTYADVAYFVFFVLHRNGRTIEALVAAQQRLRGDSVFGYSNLLGMLSALVSREHYDLGPSVLARLLQTLGGDVEATAFRLREKINLAQIQD